MAKQTRPYGAWSSPVNAAMIASGAVKLEQVMLESGIVYWVEGRPMEGGRNVVCRQSADGAIDEVTPGGFNARTRVHEYGGGSYLPFGDSVYFTNFSDNQIWRQIIGKE